MDFLSNGYLWVVGFTILFFYIIFAEIQKRKSKNDETNSSTEKTKNYSKEFSILIILVACIGGYFVYDNMNKNAEKASQIEANEKILKLQEHMNSLK